MSVLCFICKLYVDLFALPFAVSTINDVLRFYRRVLDMVNNGSSVTKALKRVGKDFTTLRRVKDLCEVSIVRKEKFKEVCLVSSTTVVVVFV